MTGIPWFDAVVLGWLAAAPVIAVALLWIAAPYGRHTRAGWGPRVSARLGWVLMEAPSPLAMCAWYVAGSAWQRPIAPLFLGMWLVHYLWRSVVYPLRMRGGGRAIPLAVVAMGACFNLVNTTANGGYLFVFGPLYPPGWWSDPRLIVGVVLFAVGMAVHLHSDEVLRRLRLPGETGYKVPNAGLHRLVASPNYLGEIVQWSGFALATWSLPGLTFAVWTAANLAPRARSHLAWYRSTFPDYPAHRRALLPFVL